jgi:hypothetical protein
MNAPFACSSLQTQRPVGQRVDPLGYRSVNKKPQVIPEEADPRPHDYGLGR